MVVPEILIDFINLFIFNQFTFLLLFVVTPYSSPNSPIIANSLLSNK